MFLCVPRAHVFSRLWVLGPCSLVCARQVHVLVCATSTCVFTFVGAWPMFTRLCTAGACSCVCHEHMCFHVCGCLAHVHSFVHGRCMFLCVPRAHVFSRLFSRLWVLGPCSLVCARQVHVLVCATSTCVFTFVGAWPMFTRLCTAGACFFYLCSKNTCDFMCVVVCPCEVFYMLPRVWNHVDCTY